MFACRIVLIFGVAAFPFFGVTARAQTAMYFDEAGLNNPTPGVPIQAEGTARLTHRLADGTMLVQEVRLVLARDTQGRFSYETDSVQPGNPLTTHAVLDPVNQRSLTWNSHLKKVTEESLGLKKLRVLVSPLPLEEDPLTRASHQKNKTTTGDLGTKTIAGVTATGTRMLTTIPAWTMGNPSDLVLRREVWISQELQLVLAESDEDPLSGTREVEITSIERAEPQATVFQPPADLPVEGRRSLMTGLPWGPDGVRMPSTAPVHAQQPTPPPQDMAKAIESAFPQTQPTATIPADQQASKEQVEQLFTLMHLRTQVESIRKMFPAMMKQQIEEQKNEMEANAGSGTQMSPELQTKIDQLIESFMVKAQNIYPVEAMLDDMAAIYQRHFTRADVEAYITFYQSPAGQHLLEQQPGIMREYMPLAIQRSQENMKGLKDDLLKELTELMKSCGQCTQPAAAPAAPK